MYAKVIQINKVKLACGNMLQQIKTLTKNSIDEALFIVFGIRQITGINFFFSHVVQNLHKNQKEKHQFPEMFSKVTRLLTE